MTTLQEIEAAAEALPREQQQELLLFLAARLRALPDSLPAPRQFSAQQIGDWIKEDEAGLQDLRSDPPA